MDTTYTTRAFWMLRALAYAFDSEGSAGYNGSVHACAEQRWIWAVEAGKAGANAVAPAGSEPLTRLYVDRQGNTLPAFRA